MHGIELRNVSKSFGETIALDDVSFSIAPGAIVALLGPSGCGKTTMLRTIAGFEALDAGQLLIGGKNVANKRPYERNIGLLFQDYALFPHMSVAKNIAYGLKHRSVPRQERNRRTDEMLNLVKLAGYGGRRPSQLSGGEQQRVALARAFAINPSLMLLDEPLAALDAKLRQELQVELKEILRRVGTTTIVVTHDQDEALGIAEWVMVMNSGKIVQEGTPEDVYLRPGTRFVAEFIGRSNLIEGCVTSLGVERGSLAVSSGLELDIPPQLQAGDTVWVCIRPERIVMLDPTADTSSYDNALSGTVIDCASVASDVHLLVILKSGERFLVIEKNFGQRTITVGTIVTLCFNKDDCLILKE